jgi:FkbM family methyltransferase
MLRVLRSRYGDRIQLEGVILSDHDGTGELRYPEGNYAWATVAESNSLSLATDKSILSVTAQMKTLDSFDLDNVGFIKIDVEGHEESVLKGGINTIKRSRPNLLIEIEERHSPQSLRRASQFLNELGYVGYYLDGKSICSLEHFDLARDQPLQNVSEVGKIGRYINNFMFFPKDTAAETVREATQRLLSH